MKKIIVNFEIKAMIIIQIETCPISNTNSLNEFIKDKKIANDIKDYEFKEKVDYIKTLYITR